jgi:hypothetical protein
MKSFYRKTLMLCLFLAAMFMIIGTVTAIDIVLPDMTGTTTSENTIHGSSTLISEPASAQTENIINNDNSGLDDICDHASTGEFMYNIDEEYDDNMCDKSTETNNDKP